jgi:hypothetical protein
MYTQKNFNGHQQSVAKIFLEIFSEIYVKIANR